MKSKINISLLISLIVSISFNIIYYIKEPLPLENDTIKDICTCESCREERIVFIAPYGKRFHYDANCAGENAMKIEFEEVKDIFPPCKKCS